MIRIRKLILIMLFSMLILSLVGCRKQTEDVIPETPEEEIEEPAESPPVTGEAATVSEGISDVDDLEDDLGLDDLEDLDELLDDIDW